MVEETLAVAPREGAWIEIMHARDSSPRHPVAPREGAWIEIVTIPEERESVARRAP